MGLIATQIGEIIHCCNQNTKICDVCLLTPKEIRNYLEGQGYTATPIKILNTNPALKDSIRNKSKLSKIADLCSDITSIEIDGTICTDFPAVISHFMEAYPDAVDEAKISDDSCLCAGGSLDYFNAGIPYPGTQYIRLIIHLSKGITGIPGLDDDILYSKIFAPYELGALPFNAYIPNRISESSSFWNPPVHLGSLNMNYVKSTVESIFSKNGMSLSSISLQKPVLPFKEYEIYNGLVWNKPIPLKPGHSDNVISITLNQKNFDLKGNIVELYYFDDNFNIFSNNDHFNYAIGYHFAHELLHQMIGMALNYFSVASEPNIVSFYHRTGGHINDQLNLLPEGSYFDSPNKINDCKFITKDQKKMLLKNDKWVGEIYLAPNKITFNYQQMEQISPGCKALFTYFKIMRSLLESYPNKTSCEIICGSKILVNTIKMMKLEAYDGF